MLPIGLHLFLMIGSQMIMPFVSLISTAFYLCPFFEGQFSPAIYDKLEPILYLASIFLGFFVPRSIFMNLIPASCFVWGCKGKAYCVDTKPISYECSTCGYLYETGWWENED